MLTTTETESTDPSSTRDESHSNRITQVEASGKWPLHRSTTILTGYLSLSRTLSDVQSMSPVIDVTLWVSVSCSRLIFRHTNTSANGFCKVFAWFSTRIEKVFMVICPFCIVLSCFRILRIFPQNKLLFTRQTIDHVRWYLSFWIVQWCSSSKCDSLGCCPLIYLVRLSFFNIDSLSIGKISSDSVPSAHAVSHSVLVSFRGKFDHLMTIWHCLWLFHPLTLVVGVVL